MKSEALLERKAKLNEELTTLGQEIIKTGKAVESEGLKSFIATGQAGKPHDLPLEKSRKRYEYLKTMGKGLNLEISKARVSERKVEVAKVQKKIDQNLKEHDRLNAAGHKLKLTLHEMGHKGLALNEKMLSLKGQLSAVSRADYTKTLKLTEAKTEVDEFVAKFYVADPEELRKLVKETRAGNKALLTSTGVRPIGMKRMDTYLGFQLTLDKDTGEILGKKPITRTVEGMMNAQAQIQEVI